MMRWIDIELTDLRDDDSYNRPFDDILAGGGKLLAIQDKYGLDHPRVIAHMQSIGCMLFQAVIAARPLAFAAEHDAAGAVDPLIGRSETDNLLGYHFVVPTRWVGLPWTWLHNGIEFLLEKHSLTVATIPSCLPSATESRPWMRRLRETTLNEGLRGRRDLRKALYDLRPGECPEPEILFVPGHCRDEVRTLIYREADGIRQALTTGDLDRNLAVLSIPDEPITPGILTRRGSLYQGLHFAAATARPLEAAAADESTWMNELLVNTQTNLDAQDDDLDAEYEGELEILGVDPVTAMLDTVSAMAARHDSGTARNAERLALQQSCATLCRTPAWFLEDGPCQPEEMGRCGPMPALVFSNSYCSLPALGARFLQAGTSAFVGPLAPLFSRPARTFASRFYDFLSDGHTIGAAHRLAALACRERFGSLHPAWLSYGVAGYGTLALQYL